jgi:hypothetical protein
MMSVFDECGAHVVQQDCTTRLFQQSSGLSSLCLWSLLVSATLFKGFYCSVCLLKLSVPLILLDGPVFLCLSVSCLSLFLSDFLLHYPLPRAWVALPL